MTKKTINPAAFACNKCGAQKFLLGKEYKQQNGESAYVIRCACCRDGNGNPHMIKNVNSAFFNALIQMERIVEEAPVVSEEDYAEREPLAVLGSVEGVANLDQTTLGTTLAEEESSSVSLSEMDMETVTKPEVKFVSPRKNDCLLCGKRLAISIPNSGYAMAYKKGTLTYFKEPVGSIVFVQPIQYCPMCGAAVGSKGV